MNIRYQLDEHIPNAVTSALRCRGIAVWTALEAGIRGLPDPLVLDHAAREGRVLVTDDAHFVGLHSQSERHAGIVFCPRGSRSVGPAVRGLVLIHDVLDPEEMVPRLEFL